MIRTDLLQHYRHWRRFGYAAGLSLKLARLGIAESFHDFGMPKR